MFADRSQLHRHRAREHPLQFGGGELQPSPFPPGVHPFSDFPDSDSLLRLYRDNEVFILQPHETDDDVVSVFNFPVHGTITPAEVDRQMRAIYADDSTNNAYKLDVTAGVILRNTRTGQYRFYRTGSNNYLLQDPLPVVDRESLEAAIRHINSRDLDAMIRDQRPSSEWVVVYVAQIEWHLWKSDFALGAKPRSIPNYLTVHRGILTQFDYTGFENCCVFVAYSQFLKPEVDYRNHRRSVRALLDRWHNFCEQNNIGGYPRCEPHQFSGLDHKDIPLFEDCFGINIVLMELKADGVAISRWTSAKSYKNTMHLNLHKSHVYLITQPESYCSKFACAGCMRLFKKRWLMDRHRKSCGNRTKLKFQKGAYVYHKTIFEKLEEVSIFVPLDQRNYEHTVCFDMEAMLVPHNYVTASGRTTLYSRHVPVSCSIVCDVEPHTEPVCHVDKDPANLVRRMFATFTQMRQAIVEETNKKWGDYLARLESNVRARHVRVKDQFEKRHLQSVKEEYEKELADKTTSGDFDSYKEKKFRKLLMTDAEFAQWLRLYKEFYLYVNRVVILSFNGQKYDLPLIITHLIDQLEGHDGGADVDGELVYETEDELDLIAQCEVGEEDLYKLAKYIDIDKLKLPGKLNVIKRSNAYASVSNNYYIFLDVLNYLPPGTNYDKFVKAYGLPGEKKLHFPYEFLDSYERLDGPLPPYPSSAWCSQLRSGIDLLNEPYEEYLRDPADKSPPKTGSQVYQEIVSLWNSHGMTCLKDYLILYNNHDTKPMLSAVSAMAREYFALGLDIWKSGISVPGLARIYLHTFSKKKHALFPLIDPADSDYYHLLKRNCCGGPSLIFDRYCKVGETFIAPDQKVLCRGLIGLDANSLYLGTLAAPMPTFMYVRRHESSGFAPKYNRQLYSMYIWLKYMERQLNIAIRSKMTHGNECRLGPYLCDGLALIDNGTAGGQTAIVLEYLGCYIHCHPCCEAGKKSPHKDAFDKWEAKRRYLVDRGYTVHFIWECQFKRLLKTDDQVAQEMARIKPTFLKKHPYKVTKDQILSAVMSGDFFGFLVVNIEVKDEMREYFQDFPPIFANSNINMSDVGQVMKDYCQEQGIKIENRRLLLSAMAAEEILLSSRLLKFYLRLGLVVTRVHQTISYVESNCFEEFVSEVTKQRKLADVHPHRRVIAEVYKLIGTQLVIIDRIFMTNIYCCIVNINV